MKKMKQAGLIMVFAAGCCRCSGEGSAESPDGRNGMRFFVDPLSCEVKTRSAAVAMVS